MERGVVFLSVSCWIEFSGYPKDNKRAEMPCGENRMASIFVYRKPLAGRVVQKRLLPMRKNKTPSAIVGMRPGNYKLQNKGRPFKNEVAKTV